MDFTQVANHLQSRGRQTRVRNNPISRHNYFIVCYNTDYHMVNGIRLQRIGRNKLYEALFPLLNKKYILLLILLYIFPIFNTIMLAFILALWIIYEKALKIYRRNRTLISDPFENMIYSPEACKRYRCMNKFFALPERIINTFYQYGLRDIDRRRRQGTVLFMIYNDTFKKSYEEFPKYRRYHILHFILALTMNVIAYSALYPLITLSPFEPWST